MVEIKEKRSQEYENEENNPLSSVDDVSYPNSVVSVLSSCPNDDDTRCSIVSSSGTHSYNNDGEGNQCQADDDVVFVSANTLPVVQERSIDVGDIPAGIQQHTSPMLEDFNSALVNEQKRQAENAPNVGDETQQRGNDIGHYMDFTYDGNDSGYSDDSASSNCEQNSRVYQPFRPSQQQPLAPHAERNHDDLEQILFAPTNQECIQSQMANNDASGQGYPSHISHNSNQTAFKEVSVEDIQTFLRSCSTHPSHVEPGVFSQQQFQHSLRFPAPVITYPAEPSINYTSEQGTVDMMNNTIIVQHSPPAFASTPRMHKNSANEGTAFVFPPYANAPASTMNVLNHTVDPDVTRITEGYRFGDTLG